MSKIFLIRHAQSANNALPEEARVCDPGLTPLGYRQAKSLAKALSPYRFRRLFCSPFLRSLETAKPIAQSSGQKVLIQSDLFEQGGCYSGHIPGQEFGEPGMGRSVLAERYPDWQIDERIQDSGWWGRPYESHSQAMERAAMVRLWLQREIVADDDLIDVLIIHADFKRLLLMELLGRTWSEQHHRQMGPIANTGLSILEFHSMEWILHSYNSTLHLSPTEHSL